MDGIVALLRSAKAATFAFSDQSEFVVASTESSTRDAFQLMSTKHIDAVPVWSPIDKRWVGFLDLKDFMRHLVHTAEVMEATTDAHKLLEMRSATFPSLQLDPAALEASNPFQPVNADDDMLKVFQLFATMKLHRVPVMDNAEEWTRTIVKIVTQSGVARFIKENEAVFSPALADTLVSCHKPVVSVNEDATVLETFRVMVERNLTAVPIVDSDGRGITPVSQSDVGALLRVHSAARMQGVLAMPVIEFIKWVRVEADAAGRFRSRALLMAIRDTSTYRDALHRLLAAKVHRLYVEDASGAMVGVVSIKDIIAHIVERAAV